MAHTKPLVSPTCSTCSTADRLDEVFKCRLKVVRFLFFPFVSTLLLPQHSLFFGFCLCVFMRHLQTLVVDMHVPFCILF